MKRGFDLDVDLVVNEITQGRHFEGTSLRMSQPPVPRKFKIEFIRVDKTEVKSPKDNGAHHSR